MAIEASQGARIGSYVLVRQLGVGGMAEVWLVRHETSAQLRAMKFLNRQFSGIPEVESRFQSEGENQLVHPNIVRIYEVGQHAGSSYMVMDFIDGRDLEKMLDSRRGPLTVPEAVDLGMQILSGLGYAHSHGIVHRDIKPSNVLVDEDGQAYLMDFGIAKVMRSSRNVTQVNQRLGTPDYMSPEQIRSSRDVDSRSDIYSFGCLFYELLTGWPPFSQSNGYPSIHDVQTAQVTVEPTPLIERKSGLPAELNEITLHCLAKAKEDRPQSCEEIVAALDAYRAAAARPLQPERATMPVSVPQPIAFTGSPTAQPPVAAPVKAVTVQPSAQPSAPPPPPPFQAPKTTGPTGPTGPAGGVAFTSPGRAATQVDTHVPVTTSVSQTGPATTGGFNAGPAVVPVIQDKRASGGGRMALIAAGIVLLLGAGGGGAWMLLHKPDSPVVKKTEPQVNPQPVTPPQTVKNDPPQPQVDKKPDAKPPANPIHKISPTPNGPGGHSNPMVVKRPEPNPPPVPQLSSGTITWSGTIAMAPQMVDIYIPGSRASVGTIAAMTPPALATPIAVTVASGNARVLTQPDAGRNYSSMKIAITAPGQQSVTLRWTELAK